MLKQEKENKNQKSKRGFPDIGGRRDNHKFSDGVQTIANNWKVYNDDLNIFYKTKKKIYNFSTGDPISYKSYKYSLQEIKKALKRNDLFRYPPSAGDENYRKIIAECLSETLLNRKISYNNLIITTSTTQAFNFIVDSIMRPYDVIIMTAPTYGLFTFIPERYDINVEFLSLEETDNWFVNPLKLNKLIQDINLELKKKYNNRLSYNPRVVAFFNENPHNPTSKVMGKKQKKLLMEISNVCKKNDIYIIDDLIYYDLTYDINNMPLPLYNFSNYKKTISLIGLSKSYNLAGIRSGLVVAEPEIIELIRSKLFQNMDSPSIIQASSIAGLYNLKQYNSKYRKKYLEKLNKLYKENLEILKFFVEGSDIKKSLNNYIKKRLINKELYYKISKGMFCVNFVNKMIPESGFFCLLDFTELKKRDYFIDENDILYFLYNSCGIKFLMGQSIAFPNHNRIIGRFSYSLKKDELIDALIEMSLAINKMEENNEANRNNDKSI